MPRGGCATGDRGRRRRPIRGRHNNKVPYPLLPQVGGKGPQERISPRGQMMGQVGYVCGTSARLSDHSMYACMTCAARQVNVVLCRMALRAGTTTMGREAKTILARAACSGQLKGARLTPGSRTGLYGPHGRSNCPGGIKTRGNASLMHWHDASANNARSRRHPGHGLVRLMFGWLTLALHSFICLHSKNRARSCASSMHAVAMKLAPRPNRVHLRSLSIQIRCI